MLATSLGLLAQTQLNLGKVSEAEQSARKAVELRTLDQGKDDFATSTALNTLAEVHTARGQYARAEAELIQAIDIRTRYNNAHGLIISLNMLCRLYCLEGEFRKAEPIASDVLDLGLKTLGPDHLHVGESLNILGWIYAATGRKREALETLKEAQRVDLLSLEQIKGLPSERQKMAFVAKLQQNYYRYLSVVLASAKDNPGAAVYGMEAVLRRKGIVLDVQKSFQQATARGSEESLATLAELNNTRAALSQLAFSDMENLGDYRRRTDILRSRQIRLEARLEELSRSYRRSRKKAAVDVVTLSRLLPDKCALIEIADVSIDRSVSPGEKNGRRYVAFVLPSGRPDHTRLVDLGGAEEIDRLIIRVHEDLLISRPEGGGPDALRSLHKRLVRPLLASLGDAGKLYVSPDGALNLLPLEILPDDNGRYFVQDYTVTYLNSGRDLVAREDPEPGKSRALLMGDPDFNATSGESSSDAGHERSADMAALQFDPLPGTRQEIQAVAKILGREADVECYVGAAANENRLFSAKSPRYLHLATHGFFLSDQILSAIAGGDEARSLENVIRAENPLIRSGLVFSGANVSLRSGTSSAGIVTAEKILGMDLSRTELVVLSACETGMGKVLSGEGVFGLRRAFAQAGADSLVMSMWPVSDRETMELMISFYQHMVGTGLTRSEALRQAMLHEMDVLKERYGSANPYLWGAFVYQQCGPPSVNPAGS